MPDHPFDYRYTWASSRGGVRSTGQSVKASRMLAEQPVAPGQWRSASSIMPARSLTLHEREEIRAGIDVHERPGPVQVQRSAHRRTRTVQRLRSRPAPVGDRSRNDQADRPTGHRVGEPRIGKEVHCKLGNVRDHADGFVVPLSADESQISFAGRYDPPLGRAGGRCRCRLALETLWRQEHDSWVQ